METNRITVSGAEELLGKYFPVLDHGFVALVDYMGGDDSVVQAARVSYGAGTKKVSEDRGLTRYLMRHWHTTPSEMVELKFHMKLPIFVARQLIRHRTANVNEYSGRYSLMPMQFYTPEPENLGVQAKNNKQGRADAVELDVHGDSVDCWLNQRKDAQENYEWLLEHDVAKELARLDLPLSLYTEWYWKIDLHNLFHFLRLRCDSHAQWEIRQFGNVIAGMTQRVAPNSFDAWVDYRLCARNFSREELDILQLIIRESGMGPKDVERLVEGSSLSKREQGELMLKLLRIPEVPNFSLDLSQAKSPEYFYEEAQKYVPNVKGD